MSRSVRSDAGYVLTDGERDQLVGWSRGSSRLAVRARIVLRCAEPGVVYGQVAADLGVTSVTVGKWRGRFAEARLDGLADDPRPGRRKAELVLTDEEREQLTRWSRRGEGSPGLGVRAPGGVAGGAPGGGDKQGTGGGRGLADQGRE